MKSNYLSELQSRRKFIRQAACAAVGTIGMSSVLRDMRFMSSALAQSNITDYKALICVFLNGGNDANNMIIPTIPAEWQSYPAARTSVLGDEWEDYMTYLRHTHSLVEETYQIDKAGGFDGAGTAQGKAFAEERLAAGAIKLRNLIYTAWLRSADPVQEFQG